MTAPLPFVRKEEASTLEDGEPQEEAISPLLSFDQAAKHALNSRPHRLIIEASPVMALDALQVLMMNILELSQLKDEAERTITHTNAFGITTKFILRKNVSGFSIKAKT